MSNHQNNAIRRKHLRNISLPEWMRTALICLFSLSLGFLAGNLFNAFHKEFESDFSAKARILSQVNTEFSEESAEIVKYHSSFFPKQSISFFGVSFFPAGVNKTTVTAIRLGKDDDYLLLETDRNTEAFQSQKEICISFQNLLNTHYGGKVRGYLSIDGDYELVTYYIAIENDSCLESDLTSVIRQTDIYQNCQRAVLNYIYAPDIRLVSDRIELMKLFNYEYNILGNAAMNDFIRNLSKEENKNTVLLKGLQ